MNRLLLAILSLSLRLNCLATSVDSENSQTVLSANPGLPYETYGVFKEAPMGMGKTDEETVKSAVFEAEERIEGWMEDGRDFVKQHEHTYELLSHPTLSDYQLRVTSPSLCDPGVKQYSGYLDITDGKHLFFWPETAPLILWLNGGPACSSTTGLLFELGPCRVANKGQNTTYNEYSWNNDANIIFLDQPINVGYSYSDDGSTVTTTPIAGIDVYAFLELFLTHHKEYASAPFHIAAESYGGTYAPNFASIIYHKNKELGLSPNDLIKINLASVILANGLTDPYTQFGSIPKYACEGPYPLYDNPNGPQCTLLKSKGAICQRLMKACYDSGSKLACLPAGNYCALELWSEVDKLGVNPYDVRQKCNKLENAFCYEEKKWQEVWMSLESTKRALGVNKSAKFKSCNKVVGEAFWTNADPWRNSALLLPELVNDGVRLLVYAGNADFLCNFIGIEAWLLELDTVFKYELNAANQQPWVTLKDGNIAGAVRSAGNIAFSAGNVTFVAVHEAGHYVPHDQPENALDLIKRWINNVPLSLNTTETV